MRFFSRKIFLLFLIFTGLSYSFSIEASFKRTKNKSFKIVAMSDLNGSLGNDEYSTSVTQGLDKIIEQNPDLIIGVGDYVSGEDIRHRFPDEHFPKMWSSFKLNILDKILGNKIEFAPSPGNHDASGYPRLKREREFYLDFWQQNRPRLQYVNDRHYPYYYSYKMKNVFFISMDDVTPFSLHNTDEQRRWIREQLESPAAKNAKARIVYGHVPLYPLLDKDKHSNGSTGKYYEVLNHEQLENNSEGLEAILIDNKVDLVVFAHSHTFFPGTVVHRQNDKIKKLRIFSMPCLGPGARYLAGQTERSPNAYAVIEVSERGNITTQGFTFQNEVINKETLPERIKVPGAFNSYFRDDKVPSLASLKEKGQQPADLHD